MLICKAHGHQIWLLMQAADPRYSLEMGAPGECSAPCGGGTRQRQLSCMDMLLGLPMEMTQCGLNSSVMLQLSEPCNMQQ